MVGEDRGVMKIRMKKISREANGRKPNPNETDDIVKKKTFGLESIYPRNFCGRIEASLCSGNESAPDPPLKDDKRWSVIPSQ